MKQLSILLLFLCLTAPVLAQETTEYTLQVVPDSAFIRALPDEEAEAVGSVFANDILIVVGRNIDGEWLEVRRPFRVNSTGGWIARRLTAFTFEVAQLPITDLTTGLLGAEPVVDTGISILTISEISMRLKPDRFAALIETIPVNLTLPVLERTPDNQWLKVNYRGIIGWVAEFTTRTSADLNTIPLSPEYADDSQYTVYEIIPIETQIAQIDGFMAYLVPINTVTGDVVNYWNMISNGETVECLPSAGGYAAYNPTLRDLTELPELRRQQRLLVQAIDDLNAAIAAMQRCGVYTPTEIRQAYADAINAQTIFTLIMSRMETLREQLSS